MREHLNNKNSCDETHLKDIEIKIIVQENDPVNLRIFETYPQLLGGMPRIRGRFVLMTTLYIWRDSLFCDSCSLDRFIRTLF